MATARRRAFLNGKMRDTRMASGVGSENYQPGGQEKSMVQRRRTTWLRLLATACKGETAAVNVICSYPTYGYLQVNKAQHAVDAFCIRFGH